MADWGMYMYVRMDGTVSVWQTGICTCMSGWIGMVRVWQTGVCTCMSGWIGMVRV